MGFGPSMEAESKTVFPVLCAVLCLGLDSITVDKSLMCLWDIFITYKLKLMLILGTLAKNFLCSSTVF